jgi:hypothetical protein
MKPAIVFTSLFLLGAAFSHAQERVVVPARNSSRPRVVNASVLNGTITVKTYEGKEVIVEAGHNPGRERGGRRNEDTTPDGLKRLELPGRNGLQVEEEDNVITIKTGVMGSSNLDITVPVDTSLNLKGTTGGHINVDGVHGEIDVNNLNGGISLTNVSGSIIAHSLNGSIKATISRVDPGKQLSFSTLNGSIDVALPPDLKANLKLHSDNGSIYTDFDVKLNATAPAPLAENNTGENGRFRIRFDRTVYGTINGGGPEISFQTFNGRISIRKKQ